ncbi:hypothetical protein NKI48_03205 [Mesorhizobium sp. M0644]|uniref:hypothetical protein n=1 Tax=Mesorhizobium sp. M0644 TaxID=2956979 RepID=UPI003338F3E7
MTRTLPAWTEGLVPIDMDGAAILLGVSRRFLVDEIKDNPHFERRGVKKVFYPEHIALLREKISCRASNQTNAKVSGTPLEPSTESAYEKALALATKPKPGNSARSTKQSSGNVIPMAKPPSGPSKKQP